MGTHNGRIDKEVARQGTGLRLAVLPEPAPDATGLPAAQAVVDRIPVPKVLWQVAPRYPRAGKIEDVFNEHPIAESRGTASAGFDSSEEGGNRRPSLVSQQQTHSHEVSSRMNGREKTYPCIRNSSTRPSSLVC